MEDYTVEGVEQPLIVIWSLCFGLQPCLEFFERSESVRDFVLLDIVHLGVSVGVRAGLQRSGWRRFGRGKGKGEQNVRLAFVLEYWIPSC